MFNFSLIQPFRDWSLFFFPLLRSFKSLKMLFFFSFLLLFGLVCFNKISGDLLEISGFCVLPREHGEMFGH